MNLHSLHPRTTRPSRKRVGRGGKRGTFSGGGSKGQKSRAGQAVRPGFRGGDNRIWQAFPKKRGASKKPGGKTPHPKHRFFQLRHDKAIIVNLGDLNVFNDGQKVTPEMVLKAGLINTLKDGVKVLGTGTLTKKLELEGFIFSAAAKVKAEKAGVVIK